MANSMSVAAYAKKFPHGCWSFLGLGCGKWYGTFSDKPDGDLDKTAEIMVLNFAESGYPVFRTISASEENLEAKEVGRSPSTSTEVKKPLN